MQTKEAYRQQLESQLRISDVQISLLAANSKSASGDTKRMTLQQLDAIKRQKQALCQQIKAYENSSSPIWGKTQHDCRLHLK